MNQPLADMVIVDPRSPEWEWMWSQLKKADVNSRCIDSPICLDGETNEQWQYMGSYTMESGQPVHSFRHRMHPYTRQREYYSVKASMGWVAKRIRPFVEI